MKPDGVFISESHYFLTLIKTLQYDTIYHEHLRYYTVTSLKKILKKYGLHIIKVKKISTHGGSIRVYATKSKKYSTHKSLKLFLKEEKKNLTKKNLLSFKSDVIKSKINLLKIIKDIKIKNKSIMAIGAPSRATTLVNYVGINESMVDCICEIRGSHKIDHYLPGTRIPILAEEIIFKRKPNYLLLLSWHISKDLIKIFRKKGYKGKFIIPLPYPKIIH